MLTIGESSCNVILEREKGLQLKPVTERITYYMEKTEDFGKMGLTTAQMTVAALMTAVMCILGPMALPLPVSPVPISLTNLVLYFMIYILGTKLSLISLGIYLLLGAVGLPVFSGFAGGLGKLAGPTGGYLLGFVFMTMISGFAVERFPGRPVICGAGMILGTAVCYLFGTVWLAGQMSLSFPAALGIGVIPYLPGDAVKIILAVVLGPGIRRAVSRPVMGWRKTHF